MKTLSIIVPVYNEERTVFNVLERLAALEHPGWEKDIIVVDDGSTDGSPREIARAASALHIPSLTMLAHEKNAGKGAAVRTGIAAAKGDYIVIQDADLEYDPSEIAALLREAVEHNAPVVYGSREIAPERRGYPHYVWGVRLLTFAANLLFGARLTDIYTCYKLCHSSVLKPLQLTSRGFEFEAEVTAKLLRAGIPIREIPIRYHPRTFAEGKKIKIKDGFIGLHTLLKIKITRPAA